MIRSQAASSSPRPNSPVIRHWRRRCPPGRTSGVRCRAGSRCRRCSRRPLTPRRRRSSPRSRRPKLRRRRPPLPRRRRMPAPPQWPCRCPSRPGDHRHRPVDLHCTCLPHQLRRGRWPLFFCCRGLFFRFRLVDGPFGTGGVAFETATVPVVSLSVTLNCIARYGQPVAVSHWDTTSPTRRASAVSGKNISAVQLRDLIVREVLGVPARPNHRRLDLGFVQIGGRRIDRAVTQRYPTTGSRPDPLPGPADATSALPRFQRRCDGRGYVVPGPLVLGRADAE